MSKAPLALLLLLTGCVSAPTYRTPEPPPAGLGSFVTRPAGVDPTVSPASDWWRLFDDPALDKLIGEALVANTDLRIAEANLRRARAVATEARSTRAPGIEVTGEAAYGDIPAGGGPSATDQSWTYNANLGVAWEVDLFGRISAAIRAANADASATEAARDAVRVAVVAQTARAYSDACAYGEALEVARSSLGTTEESLRIITAQERAGSAATFDVDRAAAQAARARAALPPLQDQRQAAIFELAALLGRTPSAAPPEAAACVRAPTAHSALPVGDGAALLRRRPDVREAERRLAADTARVGVAVADLYPKIRLGGSVGYAESGSSQSGDGVTFSVGPLISWTFRNPTAARSRVAQARAGSEASLAVFDRTVLTALKEAEQALSAYGAGDERRNALQEARDRADHAYGLASMRYRAGSLSYLDVLVAQRDLLEANSELAASTQQLAAARIGLFKALGGGWDAAAPSPSGLTQAPTARPTP